MYFRYRSSLPEKQTQTTERAFAIRGSTLVTDIFIKYRYPAGTANNVMKAKTAAKKPIAYC